jgi:hypothetical protein
MIAIPFFIFVSLALSVSAANFKRVACPDGKNTATNGMSHPCLLVIDNRSLMHLIRKSRLLRVLLIEGRHARQSF